MKKKLGLYVHWPFCKSRCRYCGFFTLAGKEKLLPKYAEGLIEELKLYQRQLGEYQVESIYLGGGTPSLVDSKLIKRFLDESRKRLDVADGVEITIEANPESVNEEKLTDYLEMGITRLSLGLQAWQDQKLKEMGRLYNHDEFESKFHQARKVGFSNIGVDLIFGLPGLTVAEWEVSLNQVLRLNPEHISCYSLELDKESFWGRLHRQGKLEELDEETDRQMYHLARKLLKRARYWQYEISNWSKLDFECKHNLLFWNGYEYLGLGAGAYSFFGGLRWHNVEDIEAYGEKIGRDESVKMKVKREQVKGQMEEFVMLRLRLIEGLDLREFEMKFRVSLEDSIWKKLDDLRQLGLIKIQKDRLKLTNKGLDVVDEVTRKLLLAF